ncbi:HIT family protein [Desertihabitans aurantiacus]|uniref:HIT family protein n=1 Tax=Desertihabitans aurantiacus TaxID=2282477 RepID=UPI000DF82A19|nr:HIT family protein [Desertihabitans aurantiacus]
MVATCIFCQLLDGQGPVEWLHRGDRASALLPRPQGRLAVGHTLVISNEHAVGVQDVSPDALSAAALLVQRISRALAAAIGAEGVNVLNASGPNSDQSVDHLHFHVVPRWAGDDLDTWPRGRSSHQPPDDWLDAVHAHLGT